jgi:hypothetical protein
MYKHDGDPNSINDDSDSNSNSEDEIPVDSGDNGYNRLYMKLKLKPKVEIF